MSTAIKVYAYCDDVYIAWKTEDRIEGCRGFALYCKHSGKDRTVSTWVGFEGDEAKPGTHKPSTEVRIALLGLFNEANASGGKIYTALYELDDPELGAERISLGKRANVILANGSVKKNGPGQNEKARASLKGKVNLYDRMLPVGRLAHDRFLVLCDNRNRPKKVWTGSTNWTKTGLCTQANNGILFDSQRIALIFKAQWDLLKKAENDFPDDLITANSKIKGLQDWKQKDSGLVYTYVSQKRFK